jgi:hypothetical protein
MAKKGKIARSAIKHWRSLEDGTYIEQRGLRRIELHTENGKTSIIHSEDPLDKARVLNRAAQRLFEEAKEKTLDQVIDEAAAAATTEAGTDWRMVDAEAINHWLTGIISRHGALSPISVAAQFLIERRNIIARLVENVPGAQLGAIDSVASDKFAEDMEELFKHIYVFADAWHWWRMELHGDHQRLLDAHSVAASRQKGAASNQKRNPFARTLLLRRLRTGKRPTTTSTPIQCRSPGTYSTKYGVA